MTTATISPRTANPITPVTMQVCVEGKPVIDAAVLSYRRVGRLDRREARVRGALPPGRVALVQRVRASDGSVLERTLIEGHAQESHHQVEARRLAHTCLVRDDWSRALDEPLPVSWWQGPAGVAVDPTRRARLLTGLRANRATTPLPGTAIYPLATQGQPWRVGDALSLLSAIGDLRLNTLPLPQSVLTARLTGDLDLTRPLGDVLTAIFEPYDLWLDRDTRAVRDATACRRHRPWSAALITGTQRRAPGVRTTRWVARIDGPVVESTFPLLPGWDPALQGEPDAAYGKATSDDFPLYRNVYRLWVLNEDAALADHPAFDLAALLGQSPVTPRPLPLTSCLTLDDAGRRRPAIVEVSVNAGADWSVYGGASRVLGDRAGVYLDDATLPPAELAAAKAGTLRVRVTASLPSPVPLEAVRYRGNAFLGPVRPRVIDLGSTFRVTRIDAASRHAAAVDAGELTATRLDESPELERWLIAHVSRPDRGDVTQLTLRGDLTDLRPGDLAQGGVILSTRVEQGVTTLTFLSSEETP